jgi:GTP-binding protein EngB required for normal cell division
MSGLNENHKRRILSTFQYADKLLGESLHILAPSSRSLFSRYVDDMSPAQYHWVEDYVEKIREQMGRLAERFDLEPHPPDTLASWALRTNLTTLDIALEDTYPEQMRGYGEMDAAAAADLSWVLQEIRRLVHQLQSFLSEVRDAGGRPTAKVLEQSKLGCFLETLSQIIARHGLVEFLPSLNSIIRKFESHRLEIAVFGRVSSGKSSLINRLLEIDLLPVGTTPITAVPIHIVGGSEPRLRVSFADRRQDLPVARLPEFATEQSNPSNAKRIVALEVEVPSARLQEGIAFVDTPGIASLATTGTQLSYAYLPDSDLGLVLVDGHSALAHEDLDLLRALHLAGIPSTVLISKCDLLSQPDVERVSEYTRKALVEHLGFAPEVIPISSVEAWAPAVNQWFEKAISPLLREARASLEESLSRKVESLRNTLLVSLEMRASRKDQHAVEAADVEEKIRPLDEDLSEFKKRWDMQFDEVSGWEEEILHEVSSALAQSTDSSGKAGPITAGPVREAAIRAVVTHCGPFLQEYETIVRRVNDLLLEFGGANSVSGGDPENLRPAAMPMPITSLLDGLEIPPPGPLARISQGGRMRHFRHELDEKAGDALKEMLNELQPRLRHWSRAAIRALGDTYRAHTDPLRYRSVSANSGRSMEQDDSLRADVELLRGQKSPVEATACGLSIDARSIR